MSKYTAQDEGRKVSPATQIEKCKSLPAFRGQVVEVFEDLDYSGKNTKRPGFTKLMQRAQQGDVALVACYSVSRLSRSVADLYDTLKRLQDLAIDFVSATEPIETATPMGRAFLGILAVLAQLEREQTSLRVADALAYKRGQGKLLGTLPAGYGRAVDGSITVDEAVSKIVGRIFDQYAGGGFSFRSLAAWLNKQGIKPIAKRGGNGAPPAPLWSGDVLKEILARPAYAGMIETPMGLQPGEQPAIVPFDIWKRCQELRQRNRPAIAVRPRHRSSPFALSPLLRCADCGASMRGVRASHSKTFHLYYACSDRRRYGTCSAPIVRADALEAELVDWLAMCRLGENVAEAARELVRRGLSQRRTAAIEFDERRTVKALENRLARIRNLYKWGDMGEAEFLQERDSIEAEISQAKALPQMPTSRECSRELADLVAVWASAAPDERARLASGILSEIQVRGRTIMAVRPRPAWAPYFEELLQSLPRERETRLELATSTLWE